MIILIVAGAAVVLALFGTGLFFALRSLGVFSSGTKGEGTALTQLVDDAAASYYGNTSSTDGGSDDIDALMENLLDEE